MSTARSWAEPAGTPPVPAAVRATADVAALLRFRAAGLRGRVRRWAVVGLGLIGLLTVAAAVVPAYLPTAWDGARAEMLALLPTVYLGTLGVALVSAAAAGGGRELLARDQGVAFPLSPTTDHLGALLMAPLNIAWLAQCWSVLGLTAYAVGPQRLGAAQVPVLLWLLAATALGQLLAWVLEWLRRTRHGVVLVRLLCALAAGVAAALVATGTLTDVLDASPTAAVARGALEGSAGSWVPWLATVATLLGLLVVAVVAGALPAHRVAARPPREETRVESAPRPARRRPASDLTAQLRMDRASIRRSVPLRRGMVVLAVLPGAVSLTGDLEWSTLLIMPALVASGGALLFGVNSWCLDGAGALWRESLPASADLAFWSRLLAMVEVLVPAAAVTVLLAALRAGVPSLTELVALLCVTGVVVLQVASAALRWSVRRPYAADMRSARATPAPPLVMVGYSARLAVATTVTALVFSGLAGLPGWEPSVVVAACFGVVSGWRLRRTAARWRDPAVRSRVVVTVAG